MFSPTRMTILAVVGGLAAAGMVLSIIELARYDSRKTQALIPAPLVVGTALERPRKLPPLQLRDQTGRTTSLAAWRGKWVVLAPSMTLCHEVCPMTTAVLMELQARLRATGLSGQVAVLEATVDPWRDSPARLRAYRRLTGATFPMLTGGQTEIRRLWRSLGVFFARIPQSRPADVDWLTHKPETFDVAHTNAFFVLDPAGQERVADQGMPALAGKLSPALQALLNETGVQNLHHPQLAWTPNDVLGDLYYLMNRMVPGGPAGSSAPSAAAAARALDGSPQPLAAIHGQAGRLLDTGYSVQTELRRLRGYPVVINAWASWCQPCKAEFPLLASASAQFGRRVAFLGSDTADSSSDARSFLSTHPVSYPSYQDAVQTLSSLASLQGLPATIFLDRRGRVEHVHDGAYGTLTALRQDIERYALGV